MATIDDFEIWSKYLYRFFSEDDVHPYMSDTACLSAEDINVRGADWLNDKSMLRTRLPLEWLIPEYGYIEDGEAFCFEEADIDVETAIFETNTVLKDVASSSGDNIWFLDVEDPINRIKAYHEAMERSYTSRILVSDWVKQHEYASSIWPHGSNSLRFLVFSPEGERPQIAAAVQKWATLHSGHADNWNKGGLTTAINNGVLGDTMEDFTLKSQRGGNGSTRNAMYRGRPLRLAIHPENGEEIMGKLIPFWAEAEEMVINASDMLREELPYIGWDVIITEDGPRIIEGNPWPGIQLIQVHYPLFNNVRFREFMEFHGVKGL